MGYRNRLCQCVGVHDTAAGKVKLYALSAPGRVVDEALLDAALDTAIEMLSQRRANERLPSFVIAHFGIDANWINVCWWDRTDALHHAYFTVADRRVAAAPSMVACVWELQVIEFERAAWVAANLDESFDPDRYLEAQLAAYV